MHGEVCKPVPIAQVTALYLKLRGEMSSRPLHHVGCQSPLCTPGRAKTVKAHLQIDTSHPASFGHQMNLSQNYKGKKVMTSIFRALGILEFQGSAPGLKENKSTEVAALQGAGRAATVPGHAAGLNHVPPSRAVTRPLRERTRRLEPRGAGPAQGGWDAVFLTPAPRCPCKALQGPARVHSGSLPSKCTPASPADSPGLAYVTS